MKIRTFASTLLLATVFAAPVAFAEEATAEQPKAEEAAAPAEKGFLGTMKDAVGELTGAVKDTAKDVTGPADEQAKPEGEAAAPVAEAATPATEAPATEAVTPAADVPANEATTPSADAPAADTAAPASEAAAPAAEASAPVDLVKAVMGKVQHIEASRLKELMAEGKPLVLVDVRQASEIKKQPGITDKDVQIPRDFLELKAAEQLPDTNVAIITYCSKGVRSAFAAETLAAMGYKNVRNLTGGLESWNAKPADSK